MMDKFTTDVENKRKLWGEDVKKLRNSIPDVCD